MIEDTTYWFTVVMLIGTIIGLIIFNIYSNRKWERFIGEEIKKWSDHSDKMRDFYTRRINEWYNIGVMAGKGNKEEEDERYRIRRV